MSAKRNIIPGGLRARMLVLVFAALVPALCLILDIAIRDMRDDEAEARATALRIVSMVAVDQEKTLEAARTLLVGLSRAPEIWEPDMGAKDAYLARLRVLSPAYANLAITDPQGWIVGSALPLTQRINVTDRKWFARVLQSRRFEVGGYEISPLTGQPDFVVCVPCFDTAGRLRAVVSAWIDLQWMNDVILVPDLPRGCAVIETDRDGVIMARLPDPEAWVGKPSAQSAVIRAARESGLNGSMRAASLDRVMRLWAYTPIHAADQPAAYIAIGIPADLAFAEARNTITRSVLLLLLVTGLIAAFAWFIADALVVRRVQSLIRHAHKLAAGDLGARTDRAGLEDELSQLERAFNEMASALQANETQTKEAESSLRLSEMRYRWLFQATPLPACVYDVETLGILNINDAAIAAYGYSREEFLAMAVDHLFPPGQAPAIHSMLSGIDPSAQISGAYTQIRKDGSLMDVETVSHGLQFAGRPVRLVIALDVTERKLAQEQMVATVQQLRNLAQRLQTAREDERARVAREVHDELGQALTGLKLDLAALRSRALTLENNAGCDVAHHLEDMSHLLDGAVQTVRRIATELRPAILDTLGLVPALEWQASDFQLRTGIPCVFRTGMAELQLSADCATAVFRVFQEALTNVARHAKASQVTVALDRRNGCVQLVVKDDGAGMLPARMATTDTFGICGMRERAAVFGGDVKIESRLGVGTVVSLLLPAESEMPLSEDGAISGSGRSTDDIESRQTANN